MNIMRKTNKKYQSMYSHVVEEFSVLFISVASFHQHVQLRDNLILKLHQQKTESGYMENKTLRYLFVLTA